MSREHSNPSTLNCQFISEKDSFEQVCRPILNKPKPKAEPPKQEEPKKEAAAESVPTLVVCNTLQCASEVLYHQPRACRYTVL